MTFFKFDLAPYIGGRIGVGVNIAPQLANHLLSIALMNYWHTAERIPSLIHKLSNPNNRDTDRSFQVDLEKLTLELHCNYISSD